MKSHLNFKTCLHTGTYIDSTVDTQYTHRETCTEILMYVGIIFVATDS